MEKEVYIIDYLRSPFGKFGGLLSQIRPDDMAAQTIKQILTRQAQIDPSLIEDVILGCANQAGEDNRNIARFASLLADLPVSVPGSTVNRLCASGMESVISGYSRIKSGLADLIIAGGVESMSRAPFVRAKSHKPSDRNNLFYDTTLGWRFINPAYAAKFHPHTMGETAENIALRWKISREKQDEFALGSHMKYMHAFYEGKYQQEIFEIPGISSCHCAMTDEGVLPDTSFEELSSLKPVFVHEGTVTSGNSSASSDGAAMMILASASFIRNHQLTPLARIASAAVAGVPPELMGSGPIPATEMLFKKNGVGRQDIDLYEINEAYAAQVLHCINELQLNPQQVNVNGGALAIGHPLGASGTRIIGHLALELKRKNLKLGIATMSVGIGQGTSMLIENMNYK
jgi:acetyl-CoA acetyltransferase family protein